MRFLLPVALLILSPLPAQAEFGLHAGGDIEVGAMGTSTATVYESRTMGAFGLQLMPGYRTMGKTLLLGLMLNLRFHSQLSSGTTAEFSGRSFLLGPAAALEFTKVKLLVGWDIRARHSAKLTTSYSGSGLRFLVGYRFAPSISADLHLITTKYKTRYIGEEETNISDDPIKSTMVGIGLSLSY